jgi:aspartate aminotransferase
VESLARHAHEKSYGPVEGMPELREKIAQFHSKIDKRPISANQVLVAPGSKILLYSVMACFEKLDVLIPAPSWVSYAPQAALLGHHVIPLITTYQEKWRITPDHIEAALAKKSHNKYPSLLILNYPGNPDGLSYNTEELQAIAKCCSQYGIYVISDEIYGLLHHEGHHDSLARHYPDRTIVTTGLSKWCGAGGWRLGVALLPHNCPTLQQTLTGIASELYSCAPTPVQWAAIDAYDWQEDTAIYLDKQRRLLRSLGRYCAQSLRQSGVNVHDPVGGFYLYPDFSPFHDALHNKGIHSGTSLCRSILEHSGVALLPATAFTMPKDELQCRLSYVDFDGARALSHIQEHTEIDLDWLRTYATPTMNAMDALVTYINQLT